MPSALARPFNPVRERSQAFSSSLILTSGKGDSVDIVDGVNSVSWFYRMVYTPATTQKGVLSAMAGPGKGGITETPFQKGTPQALPGLRG